MDSIIAQYNTKYKTNIRALLLWPRLDFLNLEIMEIKGKIWRWIANLANHIYVSQTFNHTQFAGWKLQCGTLKQTLHKQSYGLTSKKFEDKDIYKNLFFFSLLQFILACHFNNCKRCIMTYAWQYIQTKDQIKRTSMWIKLCIIWCSSN